MMTIQKAPALVILLAASLAAADIPETRAWQVITEAIGAGGIQAGAAREMLGAINSPASRALINSILKSKDGGAILETVVGLNPQQCANYLPALENAAQDPDLDSVKPLILSAIGRAGTAEAAGFLGGIVDSGPGSVGGVAFGSLEQMGPVAKPVLVGVVLHGQSAWARETATHILRRMKDTDSVIVFRSALHDPDEKVRIAGALGLAQFGYPEGKRQLEAVANSSGHSTEIEEALVGLAMLGQPQAFERLKALATSSDYGTRVDTVWAIARSENANLKDFAYRLGLERQPILNGMIAEKLLDPKDLRDRSTLLNMAHDTDEMARLAAARVLLRAGSPDEVKSIVERALVSQSEVIRRQAIDLASPRPELRPLLANQLASPYPEMQAAALSAISALGQRGRFVEVTTYMASESRAVSAAAAKTLITLDPAGARAILETGLDSKTGNVRIHSAAMLLAVAARGRE